MHWWVESGSSFEPMECDYGDLITFDAVNLLHGNKATKRESPEYLLILES